MKELYIKTPCKDCPFTKTSKKWWLWGKRMKEILAADSFTCHKTWETWKWERKQCAWHMIIKWSWNMFYRLAKMCKIDLWLFWQERVFNSEKECILHHKN